MQVFHGFQMTSTMVTSNYISLFWLEFFLLTLFSSYFLLVDIHTHILVLSLLHQNPIYFKVNPQWMLAWTVPSNLILLFLLHLFDLWTNLIPDYLIDPSNLPFIWPPHLTFVPWISMVWTLTLWLFDSVKWIIVNPCIGFIMTFYWFHLVPIWPRPHATLPLTLSWVNNDLEYRICHWPRSYISLTCHSINISIFTRTVWLWYHVSLTLISYPLDQHCVSSTLDKADRCYLLRELLVFHSCCHLL